MGPLAAIGVVASGLPLPWSIPLALAAVAHGVQLSWRESGRPVQALVLAADGRATLDGLPVEVLDLHWRGPLAFLRLRDAAGRTRRLAWWPDTLPPPDRRELRLAASVQRAARSRPSMAS